MNTDLALLSKAIQTGNAQELISRGIEPQHFADEDCREVYTYIVRHVREHRASPTLDAVRERYRDFRPEISMDAMSFLMDSFVRSVKRRMAIELNRSYATAIDDPDQVGEIELVALNMARALTEAVPSPSVSLLSDAHHRIAEYDRRVQEGEQFGIKMGIPTFDKITMGIQPHEFVVIMAFLGVGKSSLMQSMFYEAYLQGKTPLMINLEMDADSLFRRFDVMATNVRYRAMKALELNPEERDKWEKYAERADEDRHRRDIIVVDDVEGCSVDKVTAAAMRWKPDLVGVDYIGLLDSPRGMDGKGWERLKFISRQLKSTARSMGIPILAAAQANREAGRSGTIALEHTAESIAVAQDCDIMIGLQQDEEQYECGEMEALLLKNRDEKRTRALLHWDLSTMNIHERGVDEEGRPTLTFNPPDVVK